MTCMHLQNPINKVKKTTETTLLMKVDSNIPSYCEPSESIS